MDQKPNNPQDQTNHNDLDSLLKEFQSISSKPAEEPTPVPVKEAPLVENPTPVQQIQSEPVPHETLEASVIPPIAPGVSTQVPNFQPEPTPSASEPVINPNLNVDLQTSSAVSNGSEGKNAQDDSENDGPSKGSIIFIFALFLVIGLFIFFIPTISDFFKNKPGKEFKPTPTATATVAPTATPAEKEKKLTCTMPEETVSAYRKTKTAYKYYYNGTKISKVEKIYTNTFSELTEANKVEYESTQNTCKTLATTYAGITGYAVTCNETNHVFRVSYAYDLATFINPTQITIGNQVENIQSDVNYEDDIKQVQAKMEAQSAVCK